MRNPKERIIIALIVFSILLGLFSLIIIATDNVNLSAKSAYLYEYNSQRELFSKNANTRLPMASTTKIMTALVALESANLSRTVKVTKESVGIEGSSIYLRAGEELTLKDLLFSLMLRSANDAAVAIAIDVGGSLEGFVEMMNAKATELGLKNTHFDNPHGLDSENHYTTAKELALITAEAMKNPVFTEITSTYKKTVTNSQGDDRLIVNHNKLLKSYDGALGVKTGYTKKSGRSLVGCAERDGIRLISVTINAPDDWNDHKKMFDFGFSILENRVITQKGELSYQIPVMNSDKEYVTVTNETNFSVITEKSSGEITKEIKLPRYLIAPISTDVPVGEVIYSQDGKIIGKINLYAKSSAYKAKRGLFK